MNNKEKIEYMVREIMKIEKVALQKKFEATDGKGERFSTTKADADVVNSILTLLGEGKKGGKKR